MPSADLTDSSRSFGEVICAAISQVITAASGLRWKFNVADEADGSSPRADEQWYRFVFEGSLEGTAFLAIEQQAISVLGLDAATSRESGNAGSQGLDMPSVLKGAAAVLEKLLANYGAVLVSIEAVEPPDQQDTRALELVGTCDERPSRIAFTFLVTKKLDIGLKGLAAKPYVFPDVANTNAANLDLVLDVALNVTLRFGQRHLSLREILELGSGSVVELDRQVDEPVELVLDGRVVARGEAVIIDGNYGMRVTQVVQPVES